MVGLEYSPDETSTRRLKQRSIYRMKERLHQLGGLQVNDW
jgi:hypothetical protein